MSVKHIRNYYNEVAQQYSDLLSELKDFSELAQKQMIEPERIEKIKESIQPLMRNYEVLSYIMYLLDMPNRKSKEKSYENRNKKLLSKIKDENKRNGIIAQNNEVLENFAIKNGLK